MNLQSLCYFISVFLLLQAFSKLFHGVDRILSVFYLMDISAAIHNCADFPFLVVTHITVAAEL